MSKHSSIGASSMSRWVACPGSVKMSEGIESTPSSYAEEGTQAHALAEKILKHRLWPKKHKFPDSLYNACMAEYPDMYEAVMVYVDSVYKTATEEGAELIKLEYRFDMGKALDCEGLFGTADAVIYNGKTRTLYVDDYKNGAGVPVQVEDNYQLKYYGVGALLTLPINPKKVVLRITQPRCPHDDGPIRSVEMTAAELEEFAYSIVDFAEKTRDPNAPINPGSHCRWCPANAICDGVASQAQAMAKQDFTEIKEGYDPKKLSKALDSLEMIESWCKNVREFAYREAQHGRIPPGYKLVEKKANRSWKDEAKAEAELLFDFGLEESEIYESKFKSPAKIEKLFKKKKDREAISHLWHKASTGQVLAKLSDKRPAVINCAKDDFEVLD